MGPDKPKSKPKHPSDESAKSKGKSKRKSEGDDNQKPKKKTKTIGLCPNGLVWDKHNYSCAYDALFTCMYNVWIVHGPKWSARMHTINKYNALLSKGFDAVACKTKTLQNARDTVRTLLTSDFPLHFPTGTSLTSLDRLIESCFVTVVGVLKQRNVPCGEVKRNDPGAECVVTVNIDNTLKKRYKAAYSLSHWVAADKVRRGGRSCIRCGNGTSVFVAFHRPPPFLMFSLSDTDILVDPILNIDVAQSKERYAIRGAIYSGSNHFTSRTISEMVNVGTMTALRQIRRWMTKGRFLSFDSSTRTPTL